MMLTCVITFLDTLWDGVQTLQPFCSIFTNVLAKLKRAVHMSLQKLVHSSHRLNAHHYEQLATCDPASCPEQHHQAISESSLERVKHLFVFQRSLCGIAGPIL